ncbi:MAG: hypothetical protein WCJ30_06145 [Deltaproteobacteria bacterium]
MSDEHDEKKSAKLGPQMPSFDDAMMAIVRNWREALELLDELPGDFRLPVWAAVTHTHSLLQARVLLGGELGADDPVLFREVDQNTTSLAMEVVRVLKAADLELPPELTFGVTTPPAGFAMQSNAFIWYDDPPDGTEIPAWSTDPSLVARIAGVADKLAVASDERLVPFLGDRERAVIATITEFGAALALSKLWLWQLDQQAVAPTVEALAIEVSEALV